MLTCKGGCVQTLLKCVFTNRGETTNTAHRPDFTFDRAFLCPRLVEADQQNFSSEWRHELIVA